MCEVHVSKKVSQHIRIENKNHNNIANDTSKISSVEYFNVKQWWLCSEKDLEAMYNYYRMVAQKYYCGVIGLQVRNQ